MSIYQNKNQVNNLMSCQIHKIYPIEYFNLDLNHCKQIPLCPKCFISYNLNSQNLLFYDDINNFEMKEIKLNWPIMADNDILIQYQDIIQENNLDQQRSKQIIKEFISQLGVDISLIIDQMKKKIIEKFEKFQFITRDQLISTYNSISKKEDLKQAVFEMQSGQKTGLEKIQNIIQQADSSKTINQKTLEDELDRFKKSQEFLNLNYPKLVKKHIKDCFKYIEQFFISFQYENSETSGSENLRELKEKFSQFSQIINHNLDAKLFQSQNLENIFQFSKLNDQQFQDTIKSTQLHIKINEQISLIKENHNQKEKNAIFDNIQKMNDDLLNISQQNSIFLNNLMADHKYEKDISQIYHFLKPKCDTSLSNENITIKNKNGCINIKQLYPNEDVQCFTNKFIDPKKKYTLQLQIKNFENFKENYTIYLGFIQYQCKEQLLVTQDLYFSNSDDSIFKHCLKGLPMDDQSIRCSDQMKQLEIQFCLRNKYFQVTDFPNKNNITQADQDEFSSYDSDENYLFCIQGYCIKQIKIVKFTESYIKQE
ncbi:hypothetical protein ABPG74_013938 [Tetrahymena malaccensis]